MWEQQKTKHHRLRRKTNSMSPFNRSILSDPLVVTHPPKEKRNHALLWHQGVAHNNINFKHLLFTCPDKTGVLNDFDLLATSNKEALRHPDNSRTGSLPFMAVELLNEKGFNSKIPRRCHTTANSNPSLGFPFGFLDVYSAARSPNDHQLSRSGSLIAID